MMTLTRLLLMLGCLAMAFGQSGSRAIVSNLDTAHWTHEERDPAGSEGVDLHSDPATGGMDVLVRYPAGHVIAPHFHDANERLILVEGQLTVHQDKGDSVINAGGYALFPAREIHRLACSSAPRCTFYLFWDGKPASHAAK